MNITITLEDHDHVGRVLDLSTRQIRTVTNQAVRLFTAGVRKESIRTIYLKNKIPFRRAQLSRIRSRTKVKRGYGSVWFGRNAIKSHYLGKISQNNNFGFAGKFRKKKAFKIKFKNGYEGIFLRKNNEDRGKPEEVTFLIPNYDAIIKSEVEHQERLLDKWLPEQLMRKVESIQGFGLRHENTFPTGS